MTLLGPLFPFEWARVVRRQRPILGRCLYVIALLVLLGFVYLSLFPHGPNSLYEFLFLEIADSKQLAFFGFLFFSFFVVIQFSIGVFVTAGSTSAILAEEKEKQTLPFLLTTTMTDREIVFGKVGARVAQILMILLAGLPVLAIVQVMGGIDPGLLLAAFLATGATLISVAGIGATVSISAASVKQANGRAIGLIALYLVLGPMIGSYFLQLYGTISVLPWSWGILTVSDLVDYVNAGNFYWVISRVASSIASGTRLDDVLWPMLWRYLIFHGIVAAAFISWSALRLRRVLSRQADKATNKATKTASKLFVRGGRRPVSQTKPVLWRETCTAVGRTRQKRLGIWIRRLFFLLSFVPLISAIAQSYGLRGNTRFLAEAVHGLTRSLGTGVLIAALLTIISTAAGSMGRERRQKTLEELYLTDLTNREILNQKALAAIWSARWHILWVGIHWLVDLIVGGLSPLAFVIVPPMFVLYIFLAVRIGMAFAVRETQKYKPVGVAVFSFLGICGLPALLILAHLAILGPSSEFGGTAAFAAGLSPPTVLGFLTLGTGDLDDLRDDAMEYVIAFVIGLVIGVIECLLIAWWARRKTVTRIGELRRE